MPYEIKKITYNSEYLIAWHFYRYNNRTGMFSVWNHNSFWQQWSRWTNCHRVEIVAWASPLSKRWWWRKYHRIYKVEIEYWISDFVIFIKFSIWDILITVTHVYKKIVKNWLIIIFYFSVRLLNLTVIIVCLISLILCCRALSRSQTLGEETKRFFSVRLQVYLTFSEMWQFLNLW